MMRNDEGWGVVPNGGNFFARDCIHAGDFAPAGATRGQWKRTKFAVAPLDPFALRTTMLLGLYCCFIASKIALSYRNVTQSGQNVTRFDGGAVGRVVE